MTTRKRLSGKNLTKVNPFGTMRLTPRIGSPLKNVSHLVRNRSNQEVF
jgi:hypothetical protein